MAKLIFPAAVLDQHLVVLGKTGAGKSSALRHIVEDLLRRNKRVCVVDPKGDWWGLKSAADGKHAGYPVIMFGDFKEPKASDVPINELSGRHVAELIASGNRPCVIGFRGWTGGGMLRFWIDFAKVLFGSTGGELYLVIDEVHNFAPKQFKMSNEGNAGVALHWTNRLMNEGRGLGLINLIASQRPQKVHNDTLTACETLVAMRVIHKADRDAVEDWIKGCGDSERGREVLNALAGMQRGEAYVWSPEAGFGPKRLTFPMFETFDSFAPPQLQKRVYEKSWADVDLAEVRKKLADVIEKAKADDPKELKKLLAEARHKIAELEKRPAPQTVETKIVEKPVITEVQFKRLETAGNLLFNSASKLIDKLYDVTQPVHELLELTRKLQTASPVTPVTNKTPAQPVATGRKQPAQRVEVRIPTNGTNGTGPISKCQRAVLGALAQFPEGMEIGKLALVSGYKISGGFKTELGGIRSMGLIEGGNTETMRITSAGLEYGPFEQLPTGKALAEYWLNNRTLSKCQKEVVRALIAYPDGLNIDQLADVTQYAVSGGFKTELGGVRTLGLLVGRNTEIMRASPDLFD